MVESEDNKTCPYCAETIKAAAVKCKYCKSDLVKPPSIDTQGLKTLLPEEKENEVQAATNVRPGDFCVVCRDIVVDGQTAFRAKDEVQVEKIQPNMQRPEYKFVVFSKYIQKRFQLCDEDIEKLGQGKPPPTATQLSAAQSITPAGQSHRRMLTGSVLGGKEPIYWAKGGKKRIAKNRTIVIIISGFLFALALSIVFFIVVLKGNSVVREITEYSIHTSINSSPVGITVGPDGNIWFAENTSDQIDRITTDGTITEYSDSSISSPTGITTGPDGALWFTNLDSIGRITTSGASTEYKVPSITSSGRAYGITNGPDGALWFTVTQSVGATEPNRIGRITINGVLKEYEVSPSSSPHEITAGPDGALWFTEAASDCIGRITTNGVLKEYELSQNSSPYGITAGPDGALWFTENKSNMVGRITISGTITEYRVGKGPGGITAGPDGALWFTEEDDNKIGRITTGGDLTEYRVPTPNSIPAEITSGPDGTIWFTEAVNKIGKIQLITTPKDKK